MVCPGRPSVGVPSTLMVSGCSSRRLQVGPQARPVQLEGFGGQVRRATEELAVSRSAVTVASPMPAPSWPAACQSPLSRGSGPMIGRWSGMYGTEAAVRPDRVHPDQEREQADRFGRELPEHVDGERGVEADLLAAGADQDGAARGALHHTRGLQVGVAGLGSPARRSPS